MSGEVLFTKGAQGNIVCLFSLFVANTSWQKGYTPLLWTSVSKSIVSAGRRVPEGGSASFSPSGSAAACRSSAGPMESDSVTMAAFLLGARS